MSTLTYLVTVETERTEGLIASNDEQSDAIQEFIEQAVDGETIDSIGARSDSSYAVVGVSIEELSRKGQASVRAEYEAVVRSQEPTDTELRQELKSARRVLAGAERRIAELERIAEKRKEEELLDATRIFQKSGYGTDEERTYLRDGAYDNVTFQLGEKWDSAIDIGISKQDGDFLEVRTKSGGISVVPSSANVVHLYLRHLS